MRVPAPVLLVGAAALATGCGGGGDTGAHPSRPAPTCTELVTRLERARVPATSADLRAALRRLARTGRTLELRFELQGVDDVVAAFAAAARLRTAATRALQDRRATAARLLFVSARTFDTRARMLAADLAAG